MSGVVTGAAGAVLTAPRADVLGVVFGPETLRDPVRRGRAAADLTHAGAGSVVQCRPGELGATLGDCAAAAAVILALDPERAVAPDRLPGAVAAVLAAGRPAPGTTPVPPLWDGHAGPRIATVLATHLGLGHS